MTNVPPAPDMVVGTWRLVSFTKEDLQTGVVTHPFGQKLNAFVIYTADVVTIFTAPRSKATRGRHTDGCRSHPTLPQYDCLRRPL
ncbi:lipocalin-like domain-containing protein [Vineibacter terrae]|uniref:Lipocalin-like domain-containing protein n=1 Tax=Vineibacter terrae TaxID=2586908 RepID=A0A5C8PDG5_9HYPH|nr:lipocalin-like domain-containing protein [Vineibacter terrae]TXL71562.1 lipocalin-like domain-containing protein [Vineibacter terrae]